MTTHKYLLIAFRISGTDVLEFPTFELALERAKKYASWVDWQILNAELVMHSDRVVP